VRAEGLKVVPRCDFVRHYIDTHPEFRDLLAPPT
jgi:predicted GNAT family acetyltransferase